MSETRRGERAEPGKIQRSEAEWRARLTEEQYQVTRNAATEEAFTGEYWDHREAGVYHCVGCGQPLYSWRTKFESGSGWPSFWEPIEEAAIETELDTSFGVRRTEVHCSRCESHLGHVFPDGPPPTGMRHCINSAALRFARDEDDTSASEDDS